MRRGFIKKCAIAIVTILSIQGGKVVFAEPTNSNISSKAISDEELMFDSSLSEKKVVEIEGKKGEESNIAVRFTQLPVQHVTRSIEVVVKIPKEFDVKNVLVDKNQIEVDNVQYNVDVNNILRIALTNNTEKGIVDKGTIVPRKVLDIVLIAKDNMKIGEKYNVELNELIVRCNDDWDKSYGIIEGVNTIEVTMPKEKDVAARELYVSNGKNIIPENTKLVEIQLSSKYSDVDHILYGKSMESLLTASYSEELTKKNNKQTHLLLIGSSESLNDLENTANYQFMGGIDGSHSCTIKFGDIKEDGVDAQDALLVISSWLRKTKLSDNDIISLNVNADGEITTRDAIDIVDNYVSGKEFKILSK